MKGPKVNPRSLGIEADYLPRTVRESAAIKAAVIKGGYSAAFAAGLTAWLTDKAAGFPDITAATTRSAYRKALRDLRDAGILLVAATALSITVMSNCEECGQDHDACAADPAGRCCPHCTHTGHLDELTAELEHLAAGELAVAS